MLLTLEEVKQILMSRAGSAETASAAASAYIAERGIGVGSLDAGALQIIFRGVAKAIAGTYKEALLAIEKAESELAKQSGVQCQAWDDRKGGAARCESPACFVGSTSEGNETFACEAHRPQLFGARRLEFVPGFREIDRGDIRAVRNTRRLVWTANDGTKWTVPCGKNAHFNPRGSGGCECMEGFEWADPSPDPDSDCDCVKKESRAPK